LDIAEAVSDTNPVFQDSNFFISRAVSPVQKRPAAFILIGQFDDRELPRALRA
jgi:hypothetical protein